MTAGPRYSSSAILALAFLKASENDVDIFVEDSAQPAAWLALVKRCLPPDVVSAQFMLLAHETR